jgi:hypothetical protein
MGRFSEENKGEKSARPKRKNRRKKIASLRFFLDTQAASFTILLKTEG